MDFLHLLVDLPVQPDPADPAFARLAPSLATLLRRGDAALAEPGAAARTCRAFGLQRQRDWPLAPLCARADGLAAEAGYWLRLDPVHLEVGMGGLFARAGDMLALAAEEADALAAGLHAACEAEGWRLSAPTPLRWYLHAPGAPDLATTPLDEVAGEYIAPHLPQGGTAAKLLQLLNEAQMLLHAHPVNLQREAAGRLPVNGLWAWGGGVWTRPAPRFDLAASAAAEARALGAAAGVALADAPASLEALRDAGRRVFASPAPPSRPADPGDALAALERLWFEPLLRALRRGSLRGLRLDIPGHPGRSVQLTPTRAWRFWR
ncbi:MAG: hypothetical protein FD187_1741 [bacterium]|nr:MAG: hypothetical protein FD142_758 [bacterium]KAF0148695.1 MAG: hypothetical protein FD187_1741 [bacterium]KAF0168185.1 MAG: hypothetical protein FD158_1578 [bacterium]